MADFTNLYACVYSWQWSLYWGLWYVVLWSNNHIRRWPGLAVARLDQRSYIRTIRLILGWVTVGG